MIETDIFKYLFLIQVIMFESLSPGVYPAGIMAIMLVFYGAFLVFSYVFMGLALQTVAKKLRYKKSWLAWIPIANLWMLPAFAKMHWWPILTAIIGLVLYLVAMLVSLTSFALGGLGSSTALIIMLAAFMILYVVAIIIFVVFSIVWQWKICERMHRPGWWAILLIIPFFGGFWMYVMWGMLAWGKA